MVLQYFNFLITSRLMVTLDWQSNHLWITLRYFFAKASKYAVGDPGLVTQSKEFFLKSLRKQAFYEFSKKFYVGRAGFEPAKT